jgi:hypothetical protein
VSLPMEYEITPEPSEEERKAILAALAQADEEEPPRGPWRDQEA